MKPKDGSCASDKQSSPRKRRSRKSAEALVSKVDEDSAGNTNGVDLNVGVKPELVVSHSSGNLPMFFFKLYTCIDFI